MHGTAKHFEDLASVISLFRFLRFQFADLASKWSGSTHTEPDRTSNITKISTRVSEANIYVLDLKRNKVEPTKDILLVSAYSLLSVHVIIVI